jgi:hypothetical protein
LIFIVQRRQVTAKCSHRTNKRAKSFKKNPREFLLLEITQPKCQAAISNFFV